MIVEHTFATLEADGEALDRAERFLVRLGYEVVESGPGRVRLARGRKRPRAMSSIWDWPGGVGVEVERGRVSAAAHVEPRGKAPKEAHVLLLAVVRALESRLALDLSADEARVGVEEALAAVARSTTDAGAAGSSATTPPS